MGRKRSLPPVHMMHIEGLSGSTQKARLSQTTFVDDFTGEVKPMSAPLVEAEHKRVLSAQQIEQSKRAQREAWEADALRVHSERLARANKLINPDPVAPTKPGDRLIGVINGKALIVRKSWRRV